MALRVRTMDKLYEPHGEMRTRLWLLVPLRLYIGLYLVAGAFGKVAHHWLSNPDAMMTKLRRVIEGEDYSHGFYRALFRGLIQPHPALFAFLVVFGELLIGLCIVTGTLTRLACALGIVMMVNFYLALDIGLVKPDVTAVFAVAMFVLMVTGAGRSYGVDHYLHGKLPRWMA